MHAEDWLLAFVAILLPPVPVIAKRGFCSSECMFEINLLTKFPPPVIVSSLFQFSFYILLNLALTTVV